MLTRNVPLSALQEATCSVCVVVSLLHVHFEVLDVREGNANSDDEPCSAVGKVNSLAHLHDNKTGEEQRVGQRAVL